MKPQVPPLERVFFRISEFAEATSLSYHYVRKLCEQGLLAHVRLGRRILIPATELTRLQEAIVKCVGSNGVSTALELTKKRE
jgi:excisionase family DNA binding protein